MNEKTIQQIKDWADKHEKGEKLDIGKTVTSSLAVPEIKKEVRKL